jgi:transposase
MQSVTTIGLDIAKSVFQVHGVGADGNVVVRRQLKRRYMLRSSRSCLRASLASRPVARHIIGRANFTRSATLCPDAAGLREALSQATEERRHWRGSDLRGSDPTKYAVRGNQDARAAERFDASSHAASLHSPADGCPSTQSAPILPSSGSSRRLDAAVSRHYWKSSPMQMTLGSPKSRARALPLSAFSCYRSKDKILAFDRRIMAWHRSNETSMRLEAIPGVGPALATALVASVADPKAFRSGRDFSAWIRLVPKQNSSGGKDKLGSISKQGDRYLRSLFTAGALAVTATRKSMAHPGYGVVGAAAHQGRYHRAGQQDGPNGMGNGDQGRTLQGTRRTRGVKEIASGYPA